MLNVYVRVCVCVLHFAIFALFTIVAAVAVRIALMTDLSNAQGTVPSMACPAPKKPVLCHYFVQEFLSNLVSEVYCVLTPDGNGAADLKVTNCAVLAIKHSSFV